MAGSFSVRPDSLTAASRSFATLSVRLSDALDRLNGALAGTEGMAGGDKPGVAFSSRYDPAAHTVESNAEKLARGLGQVADGLDAMAHNYAGSDVASRLRAGGAAGSR